HTNLKVSEVCVGTMTCGNQNTKQEVFAQMDLATEKGINYFECAELYPDPATTEPYSRTEQIIGNWVKQAINSNKVELATKIAGPGDYTAHIRTNGFSQNALKDAVNKSLKRLQTDYIDLYQLHWPERQTNTFGIRDYKHNLEDRWTDNFKDILHTLDGIIKE